MNTVAIGTLMTFAEFESFIAANEWVANVSFDHEQYPNHPWFQIDTSVIAQRLSESAAKILTALGTVAKDDVELRHIERNALELRHVARSDPKKIFFTGPAGVGKSSLFNAIFNKPGVAKTGGKGDACTSVVVRYTAAVQHDTEGFGVVIQFLEPKVIKDFITAHSKVYYQRQFDVPSTEDFDSDVESSEVKQFETARKFFSLVFGEDDDFKKFFTPRTFEEGSFQDLCLEKSLAKLSEIGMEHSTFTKQYAFSDADELQANIEGYVSDVNGKECFWHLVDYVEIKCPFSILRHNLEFVDSPGIGELNQMRIASTNRAKDSADLLCIIGDTDRIKANELVIDSAIQAIIQHGPGKIAIIATKTDVIADQDVMQESGELYRQGREILSWIKVKRAMSTAQNADRKFIRQLSRYESYVQRQMKEAFVLDRAKALKRQVPDTIVDLIPDRTASEDAISKIPVFSISSAQYMKWANNSDFLFDHAPDLSIIATGVPELRKHLLSLAADQNYSEHETHLHQFFPGLVTKIGRVIDPNRNEGFAMIADAFLTVINDAANEFEAALTRYREGLTEEAFNVLIVDRDHYLESLDQEVEKWEKIRYPTFRKMMREHGVLIPGASKVASMRRGFNINRNISRLLTPAFRELSRHLKPSHKVLAEDLHKIRKRITTMVNNRIDGADSDLKSIEEAKKIWAPKSLALTSPIKKLTNKLDQMADSIATLAGRETDRDSFIARQLRGTYDVVYASRPQMVLKTSKKRKSPSSEPVVRSVVEKPHGVYSRELLQTLLKYGRDDKPDDDEEAEKNDDSDFVTKVMTALDRLLQKKYQAHASDLIDDIKATMQEFLDEIHDLAPPEVEVSEDSQAARNRLGELVVELGQDCEDLQKLVPVKG